MSKKKKKTNSQRTQARAPASERWKRIPGFAYEVSDQGNVRRAIDAPPAANTEPGRLLNRCKQSKGYLRVGIYDEDGKLRTMLVHKLVAEAFLGPKPAGLEVSYRDGDRENACASNLCYLTHQETISRAFDRRRKARQAEAEKAE